MKSILFFIFALGVFFEGSASNAEIQVYTGRASTKQGELAYVENHRVELDSQGVVKKAVTTYASPSGEEIGRLTSDFSGSLTAPDHVFENLATGDRHGLRRTGKSFTLFRQDPKSSKEETRVLDPDFSGDALAVGCQGLHYYLIQKFSEIQSRKKFKVKFLIPGQLEYFTFDAEVTSVTENELVLRLKASSFFVRLFAPELTVIYDVKTRRLVRYEGPSNIVGKDQKVKDVIIQYTYQ